MARRLAGVVGAAVARSPSSSSSVRFFLPLALLPLLLLSSLMAVHVAYVLAMSGCSAMSRFVGSRPFWQGQGKGVRRFTSHREEGEAR